jgi:CRISPR-associated protein Csy1
LLEKNIDGAVSGNQFSPIFQFLELELNGRKLASEFAVDSPRVLEPLASTNEELNIWNNGFKRALSNDRLSTHFLAKQVYFPIDSDSNNAPYHLLCNIKSSSLAHTIFERVFDKDQKEIRIFRDKMKYSSAATTSYPQKSRISVTASNHSNASQLNGKRGGKLHLFSHQPPTWKNQLKPPAYKKSLFDEGFFHQNIKEDIDYLRDFLVRFERIDLSIKNPGRRKWIEQWLANIIDELLFFAGSIQSLPSGWSTAEDIKLKPAHQYLLDPYRKDVSFQSARNATDWQTVVCNDFASWLNRRLIGKDKQFTPQREHRRIWVSLLDQPLREHSEMLDMELKFQTEVEA